MVIPQLTYQYVFNFLYGGFRLDISFLLSYTLNKFWSMKSQCRIKHTYIPEYTQRTAYWDVPHPVLASKWPPKQSDQKEGVKEHTHFETGKMNIYKSGKLQRSRVWSMSMTEKLCRSVTFHNTGELHVSRLQVANKKLLKISRAVCSKNLSVWT